MLLEACLTDFGAISCYFNPDPATVRSDDARAAT